jgi:hypothetical protein
MEGALYCYFGIPKNPVNEWLVANHYSRFKNPPDFFTAGAISAAIAVVEAFKKTSGDINTHNLIALEIIVCRHSDQGLGECVDDSGLLVLGHRRKQGQ